MRHPQYAALRAWASSQSSTISRGLSSGRCSLATAVDRPEEKLDWVANDDGLSYDGIGLECVAHAEIASGLGDSESRGESAVMGCSREVAAKVLIWLAAALLPVQPLPALCCCTNTDLRFTEAVAAAQRPVEVNGCCGRRACACCAGTPTDDPSCCRPAPRLPGQTCHGYCACSCEGNTSPPRATELRPTERPETEGSQPRLPLAVSSPVDPRNASTGLPADDGMLAFLSAPDRCVLLCRLLF